MILLTPDSFREINASDDKVEGLAKGVVEGKDYDLVPALPGYRSSDT